MRATMHLSLTEKAFRQQILDVAHGYGWRAWYDLATNSPRRCHACGTYSRGPRNPPGWPDLVLVRGSRLLFRELKVGRGHLEPEQEQWRDALRAAGADWAEWRPEQMDAIIRELSQ